MSRAIFDASAILALLQREPGESATREALRTRECFISAANLAEAASKLMREVPQVDKVRALLNVPNLQVLPVTEAAAYKAAELAIPGRALGLSLGDRLCLAAGLLEGAEVLTTDAVWANLKGGPQIRVLR